MEELQLTDGLDWHLVLTVWRQRPLDQEVICKLLCTRRATAWRWHVWCMPPLQLRARIQGCFTALPALLGWLRKLTAYVLLLLCRCCIRSTPTGQLKAKMQSLCMTPVSTYIDVCVLERTPADRWLARNAMLLESFEFWPGGAPDEDGDGSADDRLVSEGFAAAAAAAVADAAAGLIQRNAAKGAQKAQQPDSNHAEPPSAAATAELPLQRLVCGAPSASRMLRRLAGITPHLTSLCLSAANSWRVSSSDHMGCYGALAALTSLRELTRAYAAPPGGEYVSNSPACYNLHLQSLQHLTQLTGLDLAPGRHGWPDAPNPWQEAGGLHTCAMPVFPVQDQQVKLPPSVVHLAVALGGSSHFIDLWHMTAVTQLYFDGLRGAEHLPPCVKHLQLHDSRSLQPMLEGCSQHLRELRLDCELFVCELPAAFHQHLSQLNTLHIRVQQKGWVHGCGRLADLPSLHALVVHWQSAVSRPLPALAVAASASCTQLTRLSLWQNLVGDGSVVLELAPRLPRMKMLQQLHLGGLGGADLVVWGQVCAAVAKLPAMREVELERCFVSSAERRLAAATQLTRLVLDDGGVDAATNAVLAARLNLPQQSSRSCAGRALVVVR